MPVPRHIYDQLEDLFAYRFQTEANRRSFISPILEEHERLYRGIKWEGAPSQFIRRLIRYLDNYGEVQHLNQPRQHALIFFS